MNTEITDKQSLEDNGFVLFDVNKDVILTPSLEEYENELKEKGIKEAKTEDITPDEENVDDTPPLLNPPAADATEDFEEDKEEITDTDIDSSEDENESPEINTFKHLKEVGVLTLPDDYKFDNLEKALEDSQAYREYAAVNYVFGNIPDVEIEGYGSLRDIYKYIFSTGSKDIEAIKNASSKVSGLDKLDISNEDHQKEVVKRYYKAKGFSDEKAERLIQSAIDNFELESEAKDAFVSLKEEEERELQKIKEQEDKIRLAKQQEEQQRFSALQKASKSNTNLAGYEIPPKAKERAFNSLFRQVSLTDGRKMTDFDYRLNEIVLKDPDLTIFLSDVLNRIAYDSKKNEFTIDLSHLQASQETKAVKKVKDSLDTISNNLSKNRSSKISKDSKGTSFDWDRVVIN